MKKLIWIVPLLALFTGRLRSDEPPTPLQQFHAAVVSYLDGLTGKRNLSDTETNRSINSSISWVNQISRSDPSRKQWHARHFMKNFTALLLTKEFID